MKDKYLWVVYDYHATSKPNLAFAFLSSIHSICLCDIWEIFAFEKQPTSELLPGKGNSKVAIRDSKVGRISQHIA